MAGILKIKRDTTSPATLNDGEFYLNKGINAVQIGSGSSILTLLPLNQVVTGDIILNGNIYADNFGVSSSYAETASYAHFAQTTGNVLSSSYSSTSSLAAVASYILSSNVDGPHGLDSILSSSFAKTASFAPNYLAIDDTGSMLSPYTLNSGTGSFVRISQTSSFLLIDQTGSMLQSYLPVNNTASMLLPYLPVSQTGSFVRTTQTSSFVLTSQTSSFVLTNQTASFVLVSQTSSMTVATASYVSSSNVYGPNGFNSILSASYAATASLAYGVVGFGNLASSSYPFNVTGSTIYSYNSNVFDGTEYSVPKDNNFFVGELAGIDSDLSHSMVIGNGAGVSSTSGSYNVFIGENTGTSTTRVSHSIFIGSNSGNETLANNSIFLGRDSGYQAFNSSNSIFIGQNSGYLQQLASHSILLGFNTGNAVLGLPIKSNNIIIGTNLGLPNNSQDSINIGGIIFATGSNSNIFSNNLTNPVDNARVGINIFPRLYNFEVSGTTNISNGLYVTNSINLTGSNNQIGNYILTGSIQSTGSNIFTGNTTITGSLLTSGSNIFSGNTTISGSLSIAQDLVVLGSASFYYFTTTFVTTSTIVATGSNQLGDSTDDTQTLIGTVSVSGSLVVTGSAFLTASNVLGGSSSYIPIWKTENSLGTSSIYESSENVLIGTTTNPNPAFKLHVSGNLSVNEFQITTVSASTNLNYVGIFRPSGSSGNTNFLETSQTQSQYKWVFRGVDGFGEKRAWNQNNSSIVNINLGWSNPTQTLFTGSTLLIDPHINVTNGNAVMLRGIYYNPTISASLNTNHIAIETTTGSILFKNLPTSNAVQNVILYDTTSGQLFYTASNAIGIVSGSGGGVGVGFPFSGSAVITGSLLVSGSGVVVSGSLNVTSGITASLLGTASYADSSSYAITASYALNAGAGTGFPFSGSAVITGSLLVSGSGIKVIGNQTITGSLLVSGSDTIIGNQTITGSLLVSGSGVEVVGNQIISGALTLISGSDTENLIIIKNINSPLIFTRLTPSSLILNAAGFATELQNPLNANSNGAVRLPAGGGSETLVTNVNGEYANDLGSITLSTIPTASYVNSLSQSVNISGPVNITGSLFVSDVTYQSNQQVVSWNSTTKRFHYMAGGDLVVFPYTGSAIFSASVASLPAIDLKGNMSVSGTIGFATSSTTELRGIFIGNEASTSFSSDYNVQFPSGSISGITNHKSALFEINDLARPVMRLNTSTTDTYGPQIQFFRNRSTTAVQINQELGELRFHSAYTNSPQTRYGRSAQILVQASSGSNERSTPARMIFATTPSGSVIPQTRLQIEDNGNVGIGVFAGSLGITASATLHVSGANMIFDIPSKANGYVLQSDANGRATWVAPSTTATNIAITNNENTNDTYYITFVGNTSGNQILRADSAGLSYNPSTNVITSTASFAQITSNIIGGNTGYIPKWSGNTTLGSSVIYQNTSTNKIGIGTTTPTHLTHIYSSNSNQILKVEGSGSSNPIFLVEGSQGELFSVTDNISGSLFSVNDNSGLPIIDVVSDSTILMGNYSAPSLNTTIKLYKISLTESLYRIETGSYDAAFVEYYFRSGSNYGNGYFISSWSGSTVLTNTDTRATVGTSPNFTCVINGGYAELRAQSIYNGHLIKAIIRAI